MNRYKLLLSGLIFLLGVTSCKKSFLDVDSTREPYRQTYVKDLKTLEHFLNGIYTLLSGPYEHGIGAAYPELVSDNLRPLPSGTQALLAHYSWNQKATDQQQYQADEASINMNGSWTFGYQIIRACSFVIENTDKYKEENPSKADQMKGQAFAIRALVHFKLVNIFAQHYSFTAAASHSGIPLITTSDITSPYNRNNVAEVYQGIISDLENAISLFSTEVTDTRYMNNAAAKALLARVYLYMEDYTNARARALEVCTNFPLLTIAAGYPVDLFKYKLPNESEVLFRLTPQRTGASVSGFIGRYLRGSSRRYTATGDIVNILSENPNDIRSTWVINDGSGLWNVVKFPTGVVPEITPQITNVTTAYYPPVIRSSEMFLTVAESAAKMGDENTAKTYLDAIRQRADPTIASITATGSALLDSIQKERRKELAFEGLRMYDLQRWKMNVARTDALAGAQNTLPYPNDKAVSPIPRLDVTLKNIQQNPGY